MWISKEHYETMNHVMRDTEQKAQKFDEIVHFVTTHEKGGLAFGECIVLSNSYVSSLHSEIEKLKNQVKDLEAEKTYFKLRYAYEKCCKELCDLHCDWDSFKKVYEEYMSQVKNSESTETESESI